MWRVCLAVIGLVCLAFMAGCGGGSERGTTPTIDTFGIKINEYVGDGLTEPKPDPFLTGTASAEQVNTARFGDLLAPNHLPLQQISVRPHTNWFRLSPFTITAQMMVTLQPYNDSDPDLYVNNGRPYYYDQASGRIGFSTRVNTSKADAVAGAGNLAPDWVTWLETDGTDGYPAAQVAVYGFSPAVGQIRVEADRCFPVSVNGAGWSGTLPQTDSHWVYFGGTNGTHYTVHLVDNGGDPDVYVYGSSSGSFKVKDIGDGNSSTGFTATTTGNHFIRIYGFSATSNQYSLNVTSP